jgi:hypothetical protein
MNKPPDGGTSAKLYGFALPRPFDHTVAFTYAFAASRALKPASSRFG